MPSYKDALGSRSTEVDFIGAMRNISIQDRNDEAEQTEDDDSGFTSPASRASHNKLWSTFMPLFRAGRLSLTCVIDFPYRDYGTHPGCLNLSLDQALLERMYVFKADDNELERYSLHAHSLERWRSRVTAIQDRARSISGVNIRRCVRTRENDRFEEAELYGEDVLPHTKYLRENWRKHFRDGQREDIEWRWRERPKKLPKFDRSSSERYQEVLAVLEYAAKAREATEYYFETTRRDETQRRMRGAPVATAAAADEDEGDVVLVEKVEAIGLCIAVGDYESLPQLDKALPDSRAFVERLASRPRCLGYECSNPTETNLLTFLKRLMRELSSSPPSMLIIFYTGHVVREAGSGELCMLPTDFPASDLDPLSRDLDGALTLSSLVNIWKNAFKKQAPRVLLLVDGCRTVVPVQGQQGGGCVLPEEWSICVCRRTSGSETAPEQSYMQTILMDQNEGMFAPGQSLWEVLSRLRDQAPAEMLVELQRQEDLPEAYSLSGVKGFRSRVQDPEDQDQDQEEDQEEEQDQEANRRCDDVADTERQVRRRTG